MRKCRIFFDHTLGKAGNSSGTLATFRVIHVPSGESAGKNHRCSRYATATRNWASFPASVSRICHA